ncbi:hypothetical protein JTB14_013021 [Gonioctena quinquepunctata]|nr:hypothetical protein JTB14_013021 [Gonioctena quinquepunctata]
MDRTISHNAFTGGKRQDRRSTWQKKAYGSCQQTETMFGHRLERPISLNGKSQQVRRKADDRTTRDSTSRGANIIQSSQGDDCNNRAAEGLWGTTHGNPGNYWYAKDRDNRSRGSCQNETELLCQILNGQPTQGRNRPGLQIARGGTHGATVQFLSTRVYGRI